MYTKIYPLIILPLEILEQVEEEEEVTLRLTVSQSVYLGIKHSCRTCDQILLPVRSLLSDSYSLFSVGRPLWRENGFAICRAITQWSESRRTRNHTLLSHLRLPQPRGLGSCIYILQKQVGPVIPLGTGLSTLCIYWVCHYKVHYFFVLN
jgi:hypothetical protein